jgi:outer membrane protein OmpA-like peptidoglycan-associated protein
MSSILDLVRDAVTPDLVRKMSGVIGESPGATQKGMDAAVPALLRGIAEAASTLEGAERIRSLATEGGYGAGLLDRLGPMLGGGSSDVMLRKGSSLLFSLLGDKAGKTAAVIAGLAGIGRGASGTLLGLAAPLVMSVLGKEITGRGLDAGGLMSMLTGQRGAITSALPAGLSPIFGPVSHATPGELDRERTPAAAASRETTRYSTEESPDREAALWSTPAWRWPALAVAGLMLLGSLFLTQWRAPQVDEPVPGSPPARAVAPAVQPPVARTPAPAPDPAPAALPRQASSTPSDFLDELNSHLEDGGGESRRFVLDELIFETGSARPTGASPRIVDELADLLKDHPSARITVEGFTDSTGSAVANRQLSRRRAEAVKQLLVQAGVEAERLQAQGHGADRPVASNDTADGRARNRRIELVVTTR